MGGQVYKPPIDKEKDEDRKAAAEKSNRAWRTQNMLQSVMPSGGSGRVLDWSSMPSSMGYRR